MASRNSHFRVRSAVLSRPSGFVSCAYFLGFRLAQSHHSGIRAEASRAVAVAGRRQHQFGRFDFYKGKPLFIFDSKNVLNLFFNCLLLFLLCL